MNERGYKYGVPQWDVFLLCPVTKECSVQVAFTGDVTTNAIDRLIECLELVKPEMPTLVEPVLPVAKIQEDV